MSKALCIVLAVIAATTGTGLRAAEDDARKPNLIFILSDDQGYGSLGCYGSTTVKTPNLDRMAAEGVRLTSFYSTGVVCSPTRASFLTGCYHTRLGINGPILVYDAMLESSYARGKPYRKGSVPFGLNPDEITIAEVLKQRGYATGCIGKWHLAYLGKWKKENSGVGKKIDSPYMPTNHGFDYFYGLPSGHSCCKALRSFFDMDLELLENEDIIELNPDQTTITRRWTEAAIRFITKNKDRPFFLYLPHTAAHEPYRAQEGFRHGVEGLYECLDWSTGEILKALGELKLDEKTLVIYSSDNGGPWRRSENDKESIKGGKTAIWEGGYRVPFIARWPGRIPAGKVCDEVATTMDLYPTFAKLAGAQTPQDRMIDGRDIGPLLLAEPGAKSPHEAFYYGTSAVRSGKWKLIVRHSSGVMRKESPPLPALYDLEADIGENHNVIEKHPDVAKRLKELLDKKREDFKRNGRPGTATG